MSISINTVLRNKSLHNKHERKVQVELKYMVSACTTVHQHTAKASYTGLNMAPLFALLVSLES